MTPNPGSDAALERKCRAWAPHLPYQCQLYAGHDGDHWADTPGLTSSGRRWHNRQETTS